MSEVVKLAIDNDTISGHAANCLRQAIGSVREPSAVVVIVLGKDEFALRTASSNQVRDFDMYARAGAILDRQKLQLLT